MKDEIEQYTPKEPEVVAIGDHRVRAFVADMPARLGGVLWIGDEPTRIVALAGARRVEAIAFDTSAMAVGEAVRVSEDEAGWPAPVDGAIALADLHFVPGRVGATVARDETPVALELGTALDGQLPVARYGVTLLLDTGAPDERFDRLYELVRPQIDGEILAVSPRPLAADRQVQGAGGLALTVAAQWASERGDCLIIEAEPFDLDELLDPLRGLTVIVRVKLRDGLEILAESLDLGHCDTQLLVQQDGTLDLARSESRLTETADRFGRLAELREQLAIFGEHELDDEDLQQLREAASIERDWLETRSAGGSPA